MENKNIYPNTFFNRIRRDLHCLFNLHQPLNIMFDGKREVIGCADCNEEFIKALISFAKKQKEENKDVKGDDCLYPDCKCFNNVECPHYTKNCKKEDNELPK